MCGRMVLASPADELKALFAFSVDDPIAVNMPPRYNIAPTQPIATIRLEYDIRRLRLVRWGLVPSWVKDPKTFSLIINARVETVLEKPSFRGAIRHRRCLIPATGYYEWQRHAGGSQPYYISPQTCGVQAFAGIWEEWSGPDGNLIETAAILTQPANDSLGNIHHRMPVLVTPDQFVPWLDTRATEPDAALNLLAPAADHHWQHWPVSTQVNAVRNDDFGLIAPHDAADDASEEASQVKTASDTQLDLF